VAPAVFCVEQSRAAELSNQVGGPVAYSNNRTARWGSADRLLRDRSTDTDVDRADKQRCDLT
jgi:hypothetical protein